MRRKLGDAGAGATLPAAEPAASDPRPSAAWSLEQALELAALTSFRRIFQVDTGGIEDVEHVLRLEFRALLRSDGRMIRSVLRKSFLTELHRAHLELVLARERAREELRELEAHKIGLIAPGVEAPPAGVLLPAAGVAPAVRHEFTIDAAELTLRLQGVLERAGIQGAEPAVLAQDLSAEAMAMISTALETFRVERDRATQDEIERYERRIVKLKESLERTEVLLTELARAKMIDPGLSSIYRTVQGLGEDALREKKAALLADIFEANVVLRDEISALGKAPG